jgi:hypothetical protein
MREAERMCLQYDKQEGAPRYADVIAVVSDRRLYSAQSTGVRLSTTNLLGIRPVRGIGWHVAVLRFAEKPGFGWTWSCPLKVDHALDLHWKGLVERDKWKRFMSRLNSVCTEASIFAHAFRHGA